jgi:hypothetical protein
MNVSHVVSIAGLQGAGTLPKQSATTPFCMDGLTDAALPLPGIGVACETAEIPQDGNSVISTERQLQGIPAEIDSRNGVVEHANSDPTRPGIVRAGAWNAQNNFDLRGVPMKAEPNGSPDDITDDETPTDALLEMGPLPTIPVPQVQATPALRTAAPQLDTDKCEPLLLRSSEDPKAVLPSPANDAPTLAAKPVELPDAISSLGAINAPIFSTAAISQALLGTVQTVNGQLNLEQDTLWIDDLAHEIAAFGNEQGKLRFGLSPKGLGHLEVAIDARPDGVDINLVASTESATRIFAAEQSRLVEELRQSGVRLINSDLIGGQQASSQRQNSHPNPQTQLTLSRGQPSPKADAAETARNEPHAGRFA